MIANDYVNIFTLIIICIIEYDSLIYIVNRPKPNRNSIITGIIFILCIVIKISIIYNK